MKKIKIYELAGIPGSGKTTVFNDIKSVLPNVYTRQELLDIYRRRKKIVDIIGKFYFRYSKRLNDFINEYPDVPDFIREALIQLFVITKVVKIIHPNLNFIYDEGYVQNISAVPYRKNINDNEKIDKYIAEIKKYFDVDVIYLDIDSETAFNRTRQRASNNRFDSLNDVDLKDYLDIKRSNLKLVLSKFDKIYMYYNTEELVEYIRKEEQI